MLIITLSHKPHLLTNPSEENNFRKRKTKSLEDEINNLENYNNTLTGNIHTQLTFIENVVRYKRKTLDIPI